MDLFETHFVVTLSTGHHSLAFRQFIGLYVYFCINFLNV